MSSLVCKYWYRCAEVNCLDSLDEAESQMRLSIKTGTKAKLNLAKLNFLMMSGNTAMVGLVFIDCFAQK